MAYTIYRNVKVLNIKIEEVKPINRPADISGNKYGRDSFSVYVAELSNHKPAVTFSDFKGIVTSGHTLSLAVNDRNDVIAVINHTTGKEGFLTQKNYLKDVSEGIFPILFISALFGGIAYKAFGTNSYHDLGYVFAGIGVILIGLLLRGVSKQYRESRQALEEMKNK